MRKLVNASFLGLFGITALGTPAQAQEWAGKGEIIAAYYNEVMSIPRGWSVKYMGLEDGYEVFLFMVDDRDPASAMTRNFSAEDQLKRLLCDDDELESWVRAGMRAKARKVWYDGANQNVNLGTRAISCD